MRVVVETQLDAPPEAVFNALLRPALLIHVAKPILIFRPIDEPFPPQWAAGRYRARLWLGGLLPLGRQRIEVSFPRPRAIRDNGSGDLVKRWDHLIELEDHAEKTLYRDRVEIEAGVLTLPIWTFAMLFYRWRQMRLRRLVARGLDTL